MVLGGIRIQVEQSIESKLEVAFLHGFCSVSASRCLPWLSSVYRDSGYESQIDLPHPKLLWWRSLSQQLKANYYECCRYYFCEHRFYFCHSVCVWEGQSHCLFLFINKKLVESMLIQWNIMERWMISTVKRQIRKWTKLPTCKEALWEDYPWVRAQVSFQNKEDHFFSTSKKKSWFSVSFFFFFTPCY